MVPGWSLSLEGSRGETEQWKPKAATAAGEVDSMMVEYRLLASGEKYPPQCGKRERGRDREADCGEEEATWFSTHTTAAGFG